MLELDLNTETGQDCFQHACTEAADGIIVWEFDAETEEEKEMTRLAALEVSKRIRKLADKEWNRYTKHINKHGQL
jgi:hypothetical protein